jgi:radical SAM superfamily enzyme YgiQ (UPF0313 family)
MYKSSWHKLLHSLACIFPVNLVIFKSNWKREEENMDYEGTIYRPPSEAYSLLIQVTTGCSHNKCTFCGNYQDKKFKIKSLDIIKKDLQEARSYGPVEKVFLCDGDALIIPQVRLEEMLRLINENIPTVKRIGTYGNTKSILKKSVDELKKLKELGLKIIYLGVETGNAELLKKIKKGATYEQMVEASRRVKEAGILLSATVILGLGGIENSIEHSMDTARILTDMDPDYVGALTLMLVPGTELYGDYKAGKFVLPDKFGFLRELYLIIANSNFTNCFFAANHASNYLPIRANLPQDKEKILTMISSVIDTRDLNRIRPEYLRAL